MLEAQLAKIRLEKENMRVADKLKNSVSDQLIDAACETAVMLNATDQEKDAAAVEKALRDPVKSTSLVRYLLFLSCCQSPACIKSNAQHVLEDCSVCVCVGKQK